MNTTFAKWTVLSVLLAALMLVTVYANEDDHPSYMSKLFDDLTSRKKLFDETPPEEIKYWFEYAGPLQVRLRLAEQKLLRKMK